MRPFTWIATLATMVSIATPAPRTYAAATDSLALRTTAAADDSARDTLPAFAPDFMLPDASGRPHRFLGYPGRLHVLVYWSPECPECKQDLPRLADLYARERGNGLAMVTVTGGRLGPEAAAYAKERGYRFPVLFDEMGKVVRLYNVRLTPTVCVVRGGRVLYRHEGYDPAVGDSLVREVESLLE